MKSYDPDRVERAATNVTKLLYTLLAESEKLMKESIQIRKKIRADLEDVVNDLEPKERGAVHSAIAVRAQEIFDAGGSPKVKISGGCAGRQGLGIRAVQNGFYAGVCVTGSLDEGITGGGVEVGGTY